MIYVVVVEWNGLVEEVEAFIDKLVAEKRKQELTDKYGRDYIENGDGTIQVHDLEIFGMITCEKCHAIMPELLWKRHGNTLVCPACGGLK